MTTRISTHAAAESVRGIAAVWLCAVFLMGAGLVYAAGFAGAAALHDAAHDTRHGLSFPCH